MDGTWAGTACLTVHARGDRTPAFPQSAPAVRPVSGDEPSGSASAGAGLMACTKLPTRADGPLPRLLPGLRVAPPAWAQPAAAAPIGPAGIDPRDEAARAVRAWAEAG